MGIIAILTFSLFCGVQNEANPKTLKLEKGTADAKVDLKRGAEFIQQAMSMFIKH